MIGMAIAIVTTLALSHAVGPVDLGSCRAGIAIGGGIGAWRARTRDDGHAAAGRRVPFLVGLAAVFVAAGALYAPQAFGIGTPGAIHTQSLIEMRLGVAIGAITFAGSLIAFLKLNGHMTGAPILLPQRHALNIVLGVLLVVLIVLFVIARQAACSSG